MTLTVGWSWWLAWQLIIIRWLRLPFMGITYSGATYVDPLLLVNSNWSLAHSSKRDLQPTLGVFVVYYVIVFNLFIFFNLFFLDCFDDNVNKLWPFSLILTDFNVSRPKKQWVALYEICIALYIMCVGKNYIGGTYVDALLLVIATDHWPITLKGTFNRPLIFLLLYMLLFLTCLFTRIYWLLMLQPVISIVLMTSFTLLAVHIPFNLSMHIKTIKFPIYDIILHWKCDLS